MKIGIVVPVKRGSIRGNEVTAIRWQSILEELNHEVSIFSSNDSLPKLDCLIAIHAVHSHEAAKRFKSQYPELPLIVCLSGTDLHGVFDDDLDVAVERRQAEETLQCAEIILLLEPNGMRKLPEYLHAKCRVVYQAAEPVSTKDVLDTDSFPVSIIGHLRHQKDPMLAARATRLLPPESKVQLIHIGGILEERYVSEVQQEMTQNPRYRWLGKLDHQTTLNHLVASELTLLTSVHEGAPSIISEAVVNEIPILATRIDATEGMLGFDYPGLFDVGDEKTLSVLISRAEQDRDFLDLLKRSIGKIKHRYSRQSETEAWRELLKSLLPK